MAAAAAVKVDFTQTVGPVRPMHGVGQPPLIYYDCRLFSYLKEAGVPYSRLHDVGGAYGMNVYVDIPNLFRDFDADENDPKSFDFAFTDHLLKALVENGVEPYFRLGVTIENRADIRRYRAFPPKDPAKWARICERVIRHYTEGWADGFKWKITYWEIWNEPECNPAPDKNTMWHGTWDEYLNLYDISSKHLKKCFPHLKIGGYGSCGFYAVTDAPAANTEPRMQHYVDCFVKFLDYVKARDCPLDFFSFHTYGNVEDALKQSEWCIATLKAKGFGHVETSVNEWLPGPTRERLGSAEQAADVCAEMIGFQRLGLSTALIYDARCGVGEYSPLFNPLTCRPHKAYYALKCFNELYRLRTEVASSSDDPEVYVAAAGGAQGGAVLVANISGDSVLFAPDLGGRKVLSCRITDATRTDEEVSVPSALPPHSFVLLKVGCCAASAAAGGLRHPTVASAVEDAHTNLVARFLGPEGLLRDYEGEIPTPEDCRDCRPNAMGWWSPIENGPMFTGLYIEAVCSRARRTRAPADIALARKLAGGLLRAASVSPVKGMVVRGFGTDGVCHYPLGSVDQTLPWFYGLYAYWRSGLPSADVRDAVAAKMREVADALEANGWECPCDGAFTGQSRGRFVNEGDLVFRAATHTLFMFRAVWEVTGDEKWKRLYEDTLVLRQESKPLTMLEVCREGWVTDAPYFPADGSGMWIYVCAQGCLARLAEMDRDNAAYFRAGLARNAARARPAMAHASDFSNVIERPFKYANWRTGYRWRPQKTQKDAEEVQCTGDRAILGTRKHYERETMTTPLSAAAVCAFAGEAGEDIDRTLRTYDYSQINICEFFLAEVAAYAIYKL